MRRVALFALVFGCKSSSEATPPADTGPDTSVESCYEAPTSDDKSVVAAKAPLIQYVDPFIGTGGVGFGTGSTFPGPQVPYGMARPGPDTMGVGGAPTFSHCVGYAYEDNFIYGFSQSRLHGIGIVDAGILGMMPVNGAVTAAHLTEKGRRVGFSHKNEKASPGYYSVTLDNGIKAELTATAHVAYHRYTLTDGAILFDVGHELPSVKIVDGSVTIDPAKQEISGFAHYSGGYSDRFGGVPMYFVAKATFDKSGSWKGDMLSDATTQKGGDTGAWINAKGTVTIAVALSFVDVEHARKNLEAETLDFDAAKKAAEDAWEKELSRVMIEARSARDLKIAYSALYHTLLMPTLGSDVDGAYRGLDGETHTTTGWKYYTDFSLWDTYRSLHPWLTLVYPEHQTNFLKSMTAMAIEGKAPPKWPLGIGETQGMVGDSAAIVISESYQKGLRDFDAKGAYAVLKQSANGPLPKNGRSNIAAYIEKGFIPIESGGSSGSSTLEYAYNDAALATFAEQLGEKADAETFKKRSGNWKNLYDAQTGFLLGRHADGTFPRKDDMLAWQDYWAEGTTWHYTWFVPHDLPGLAETMGGKDKFLSRIDEYFALSTCQPQSRLAPKAYYWHSNEPVLFVPWIYAELDQPGRGAQWLRWALANEYGDGPDGVPGNDDGGTMSAWYLFAGMGFFPRVGATEYLLGSPIFPKTTLKLPGGTLTITAPETSAKTMIPKSFKWNGKDLARPRIEHSELAKGGTLEFVLSAQ